VRQLHRAFEPTGTSFARRVLERRLAACRAELASPAAAGRTVADVAFGCGFDNLVTFYRAFRRAYGCTPGEVRPAAVAESDLRPRTSRHGTSVLAQSAHMRGGVQTTPYPGHIVGCPAG
jgi:AraC-like DNA-binding protein